MLSVVASLGLGGVVLAAAGTKLADRLGAVVALETYGLAGAPARLALAALVSAECALGAAVMAGVPGAAWGLAAMLATFAVAQAGALVAGRTGSPCGCMGARGRLSWGSAGRTAALGGGAIALAASGAPGAGAAGAAGALAVLAAAAVWTRPRAQPDAALDVAGEGPRIGEQLAGARERPGPALLLYTSASCRMCEGLRGALDDVGAAWSVWTRELDEDRDASAWALANVPGSPYAVVVDGDGTVQAKGTVNTRRQLDSLLGSAGLVAARPGAHSRRGFLERAAGAAAALTAGSTVGALVAPGEAEAFHFCGHIYTTDGCPHPTGLPRIDSRGFPLRARDGHRVDDLGRLVDVEGRPVGEDGGRLLDADGAPLPPATRTRVCVAAGDTFGIRVRTDGAWYRCCGGHVRKLVDCCTTGTHRINGDRGLKGYCYGNRRVFCVMYYQTRVPC